MKFFSFFFFFFFNEVPFDNIRDSQRVEIIEQRVAVIHVFTGGHRGIAFLDGSCRLKTY